MEIMTPSCLNKTGFSKKEQFYMPDTKYLCKLRFDLAKIELLKRQFKQLTGISNSRNRRYYGCRISLEEDNLMLHNELKEQVKTLDLDRTYLLSMDTLLSNQLKHNGKLDDNTSLTIIGILVNIETAYTIAFNKMNQVTSKYATIFSYPIC
jgi:hypothetical protein